MKKWFGLFLVSFLVSHAGIALIGAQSQTPAAAQDDKDKPKRLQPGATATPTNENEPTPKFNMDYFLGEWKFESNLSESPISSGDQTTGTETVANMMDGRFWDITIKRDAASGPIVGKGVLMYQDSFSGQFFTRFEYLDGVAMIKTGSVGCDLGGTCNMYFETPPFEHNGSSIQLKGRYSLTSPFSYRLTTEISVDKAPFRNLGSTWYTKQQGAKPEVKK